MIPRRLPVRMSRVPLSLVLGALALAAFVPAPALATSPNPYLVKNINKSGGSDPQSLTAVGDMLFFTANDGVHDRELWVSDGTAAGTHMVKDILTTPADYAPYWPGGLTAINGLLYFSATDGVHGYEPWISDGTEAGTHMIKDIEPAAGVFGSDPVGYTELNGIVYFNAKTRLYGEELWRTDGTDAGTYQVADLTPGSGSSFPEYMVAFKNKLYFVRHDARNSDKGTLFRTDGTAAGTKAMRDSKGNKIKGTFNYGVLRAIGDHLFIGRNYKELWVSGGTPASTKKLVDIGTRNVIGAGDTAYFVWQEGTQAPASFLWRSDGTPAGTQPVTYSDGSSISPGFLTPFGSDLVFWGSDSWNGDSTPHTGGMSITDGTNAGTHALGVYSLPTDYTSDFFEPTPRATLNQVLYYPAQTYDGTGAFSDVALWRTDGTGAGTYAVSPEYASGILTGVTAVGNKVFFVTKAGSGTELWAYVP